MSTQVLQVITLALTVGGSRAGAVNPLNSTSAMDPYLTVFAVAALVLSVILLFLVSAAHRCSENYLNQRLNESLDSNVKLRQRNYELMADLEEQRQRIAELSGRQANVLENVTGAMNT
jgi:hypothetical protein